MLLRQMNMLYIALGHVVICHMYALVHILWPITSRYLCDKNKVPTTTTCSLVGSTSVEVVHYS